MPRHFFNIHNGESIPDLTGLDLPDIEAAKHEAIRFAGSMLSQNPGHFWNGEQWHVDVCDEQGDVLFALHFVATMGPVGQTG